MPLTIPTAFQTFSHSLKVNFEPQIFFEWLFWFVVDFDVYRWCFLLNKFYYRIDFCACILVESLKLHHASLCVFVHVIFISNIIISLHICVISIFALLFDLNNIRKCFLIYACIFMSDGFCILVTKFVNVFSHIKIQTF